MAAAAVATAAPYRFVWLERKPKRTRDKIGGSTVLGCTVIPPAVALTAASHVLFLTVSSLAFGIECGGRGMSRSVAVSVFREGDRLKMRRTERSRSTILQ